MNSLFKTVTTNHEDDQQIVPFDRESITTQVIFIRDLALEMSIGVLDAEKKNKQRVLVNAELRVSPNKNWRQDNIQDVVSYTDIAEKIKMIAEAGHINLVETFAEKIIEECFQNLQVEEISVTIEKPDVMPDAGVVGVTITRSRI